jgi:hypothetical protein
MRQEPEQLLRYTLKDIRAITELVELGWALGFYAANQLRLTIGDDSAFRSVFFEKLRQLKIDTKTANNLMDANKPFYENLLKYNE